MNGWINSEEPSDDAFTQLWCLWAVITLGYFLDMYRERPVMPMEWERRANPSKDAPSPLQDWQISMAFIWVARELHFQRQQCRGSNVSLLLWMVPGSKQWEQTSRVCFQDKHQKSPKTISCIPCNCKPPLKYNLKSQFNKSWHLTLDIPISFPTISTRRLVAIFNTISLAGSTSTTALDASLIWRGDACPCEDVRDLFSCKAQDMSPVWFKHWGFPVRSS